MELSWQVQDSEELVIPEEVTKQEGGARGRRVRESGPRGGQGPGGTGARGECNHTAVYQYIL